MSTDRRRPGRARAALAAWSISVFALFASSSRAVACVPGVIEPPPPAGAPAPAASPAPAATSDEASTPAEASAPDTSVVTEAGVSDSDIDENRRQWTKFNQYDGPYSTFRWGFGFLTDFVHHEQDTGSKQQFGEIHDETGVRDSRLLFSGKFKTKREFTWTTGLMYDGADGTWHARQTGFLIGIPELHSRVFLGRTKEGYSMVKVMTGYYPWMIERSETLDAFVPILADGVKWMYWHPEHHTFFSLGYFLDTLSEKEKFATADNQVVGRFGWQPILSDENKEVLHVAVMARRFKPDEGSIKVRSRPESYLSPYFLDAGTIKANWGTTTGFEAYYRKHSWLFGTEYNWQQIEAVNGDKPLFHGGDAVVSWILTGETRPYNAPGAYFSMISPEKSVFKGGPGAWEAVLHYSYSDFDSLTYRGGKFWRITPMMNWFLNDQIRLEFVYGYGKLDRFDVTGATQFFQARIQIAL